MKAWSFGLLLTLAVSAETRLDQLLTQQRQHYPQAQITGGFWDARGISRYRSQPGLHAGYDIAMPAGYPARAAWPGTVAAIIPWAEGEWGVKVVHADGTSATYGHLVPSVQVGQKLNPGEFVGSIARDHLDVKMRDAQGQLFDYGQGAVLRLSIPALPSGRALAWQQKWRQCSDRPSQDRDRSNWLALRQAGLSVDGPPEKEAASLAQICKEWKAMPLSERSALRWDQSDRQRLQVLRDQLDELNLRYEAGLVAANRVLASRQRLAFWEELLRP